MEIGKSLPLVTLRKLELHFFASKQVVSFATE